MADLSSSVEKMFKCASLPVPVELTLKDVKLEEVGQNKEALPVARFSEDPRGLVLSAGRYNILAAAHGSRDTDTWIGCKVKLVGDPTVRFAGKVVGGVVLSVAQPAKKAK